MSELVLLYIGEKRKGYFSKYNVWWKEGSGITPISIELTCFREKMGKRMPWSQGGVTPEDHFKNIARAFWPENAGTGVVGYIWNDWSDKMLKAACENQYLGVAGCSGSGKSEFFSLWAIINFLSDPMNTIILTTARTLVLSRLKVWGKVVKYWTPLKEIGVPGKLLDSVGTIRYIDTKGDASQGDMAGIKLIPSEPKQEKESIGTIRGIHQKTVIFIADDMPDLSKSIMEGVGNLSSGCERFQFIGLGNPYSYFDVFGNFTKPAEGWESITVDDDEWKTERGICLHFDDTRNPRITMGDERLTWLNTKEKIDEDARINGGNTARFWRERRGFWCPTGTIEQVYTEQEILGFKANEKAVWLDNKKTPVSFLDPSFTTGGDRTIAYFGTLGTNLDGLQTLQYDEYIEFQEDITDKELGRTQQLIKWWRTNCVERKVSPRYAGFDSTGTGSVLGDDIRVDWSREVLAVHFGGKASDRAVSAFDPMPGEDRYANRVSEIWYSPKEAMRTGQIRGLGEEVIQEMCLRKKTEEKGNNIHLRIRVQSKPEMKAQGIRSPDCFVAGTMVHTKLGQIPIEEIKIGDMILTPFGYSPVILTHEHIVPTTIVEFSRGVRLQGTGAHKILVPGKGWVRLDELSVDTMAESVYTQPLWKFLELLFTRVEPLEFKHLVNTIKVTQNWQKRDFFTEPSGATTLGLSLKVCASIIKMTIGQIIPSKIWNSWRYRGTPECTLLKELPQCLQRNDYNNLRGLSRQPQLGISQKRGWLGIKNTGGEHLEAESLNQSNVLCAEQNSPPEAQTQLNFAPGSALADITKNTEKHIVKHALSAAVHLMLGVLKSKLVVEVAPSECRMPQRVFNLTLLNENAYYANGILVQNCADAAMGLYELCRERLGFNSAGAVRKQSTQISGGKSFKDLFGKMDLFTEAKDRNTAKLGVMSLFD